MRIVDLPIPALTDLDHSERLMLILAIRKRRRFVDKLPRMPKATSQRSKIDPLFSMTREQLEKLLEVLTDG